MKVIFLDIDGVLQPPGSQRRFSVVQEDIIKKLSDFHHVDYSFYCDCDVTACYLDWNIDAVNRIKTILEKTNAKIVVSSDWQDKRYAFKMRDLLKLHGLDKYYFAQTTDYDLKEPRDEFYIDRFLIPKERKNYNYRVNQILHFLDIRKGITNYVAIDDMNLREGLFDHFVQTRDYITDEQMQECINILEKND